MRSPPLTYSITKNSRSWWRGGRGGRGEGRGERGGGERGEGGGREVERKTKKKRREGVKKIGKSFSATNNTQLKMWAS